MSIEFLRRLPDREAFLKLLHSAVADTNSGIVAVIIVKVRRLRDINLELGYEVGDQILGETARRVASCLRPSDQIARLSATEFGLILPSLRNVGLPRLAVNKIQRVCSDPLVSVEGGLKPQLTFGISLSPAHANTADALLQCADRALCLARGSGHGVILYEADSVEHSAILGMEHELEYAIEHGGLNAEFQPKIELSSGLLAGVEMLTRWKSPRFGMVNPERFIDISERSGLITSLTVWGLHGALRECKAWAQALPEVGVAVNLSTRLLSEPELPDIVGQAMGIWDIEPSQLTLEVTESALMTDPELALSLLEALHTMGVRLSIDDFGTGYSSLAYLKHLPVDELKIDKSFVLNMENNPDDKRIVQSVVDLASNFDLSVVAEGIEDEATLDSLTTMGCRYAQGYYIAKPMSADQLEPWVGRSRWGTKRNGWEHEPAAVTAPSGSRIRPQAAIGS